MKEESLLRRVYYNPKHPAGFSSAAKLAKATGLAKKKVIKWLMHQDTYTLHRASRKRYPTRKYIVHDLDEQWQSDLIEITHIADKNRSYRYLLTVIDIFSRYAWCRPLRNKKGETVAAAFADIFKEGRIPKRVQTDQGKEFQNRSVFHLFRMYSIEWFAIKSPYKAALVERFNRTLKERMWKYFTAENNFVWTKALQNIIHAYNHSIHRSIGRKPADVSAADVDQMREEMYQRKSSPKDKDDIRLGQKVRISKMKSIFAKSYLPSWTEEIFTVSQIQRKYKPITYKLSDYNGETLEGGFYRQEIQPVLKKDDVYLVENIIRKQRRDGEMWCFVKWKGYPKTFNSWVRQSDIQDVKRRY